MMILFWFFLNYEAVIPFFMISISFQKQEHT